MRTQSAPELRERFGQLGNQVIADERDADRSYGRRDHGEPDRPACKLGRSSRSPDGVWLLRCYGMADSSKCDPASVGYIFCRRDVSILNGRATRPSCKRKNLNRMTRRVVLAGGGHAHLAVLADWARKPLAGIERTLVTASRFTAYSGMLPGWLAGIYRGRDLLIDLKPIAEKAGAKLVVAEVMGLEPARGALSLSSGEEIRFDLLSLATGGETDTSALAALGDRLLPIRPVGEFMTRWAELLRAKGLAATINIVVVGGGAAGVELALGVQTALRHQVPDGRVSLVAPQDGFLSGHAAKVQKLALTELVNRGIAVHFAQGAGEENGVLLSNGAFLPADCVIAATGSKAPRWLAQSGLACNADGFVAVGADLRSTSHPAIFAAGDIIDRVDLSLERSGVHAVKAGPVLATNLRAAIEGASLSQYLPRKRSLYLLALGDRRTIVSWGCHAASGRWAWRIKDWIDRHFVERHRIPQHADASTTRGMMK